jgi:hypothetical protein
MSGRGHEPQCCMNDAGAVSAGIEAARVSTCDEHAKN